MTSYWGVDLGVRTFSAASLSCDGTLSLHQLDQRLRGKVRDQSMWDRVSELVTMSKAARVLPTAGDVALIEEPPLAGGKNPRTFLKLSQASSACGVGMELGGATVGYVPVDTWKKGTVGRGGADKELVARWLERSYPSYYEQCAGDQNLIDATCIAIYAGTVAAPGGALAGSMDQARRGLAAS